MWFDVAARAAEPEQVIGHDVDAGAVIVLRPALVAASFADPATLTETLQASADPPGLATCLDSDRAVVLLAGGWADAWSFGADPGWLALGPSARADALCTAEKLGCGWTRLWSRSPDPLLDAAIRHRGARAAAGIDEVVAGLARAWHDPVVVGGLVLPSPGVTNGRLVATGGPPQEVSVVWGPDGTVLAVTPSPTPGMAVASPVKAASRAWPSPIGPALVWSGTDPTTADVDAIEALAVQLVIAPGAVSLDAWRRLAEAGVRTGVAANPPARLGSEGAAPGPTGPWCVWVDPPPPVPEAEEAWEAGLAPPRLPRR